MGRVHIRLGADLDDVVYDSVNQDTYPGGVVHDVDPERLFYSKKSSANIRSTGLAEDKLVTQSESVETICVPVIGQGIFKL